MVDKEKFRKIEHKYTKNQASLEKIEDRYLITRKKYLKT